MTFRRIMFAAVAAGLGLTAALALAQEPAQTQHGDRPLAVKDVALSAVDVAQAPRPATPAVPRLTGLDGWVLAGETAGMRLYVKPEPLAGRLARLSARIEEYGASGPFSSVSLEEYDCPGNRQRMRSATSYEQNNLAGPADVSNEITAWFEPKPDTLEQALQIIACEDGQPRSAKAILAMDPRELPAVAPAAPAAAAIPNTEGWLVWLESDTMTVLSLPSAPVGNRGRAWLRAELPEPTQDGARSIISLEEVDCARRRTRTLQETYYPENGMQGARDLRPAPRGWTAVDQAGLSHTLYESLCDGKTPRPIVGGASDPGGVFAWISVEAMDWIELGRDADEASFALKGPKGEHLRLWLRTERRLPLGEERALSMVDLYDFDCRGQRYRMIQRTLYKDHNMVGEGKTDATVGQWAFFTPGSAGEALFKVACGVDDDGPVPAPVVAPLAPVKL